MKKELQQKLENLFWERYIDMLSNTENTEFSDIIDFGLIYLDNFYKHLDKYVNSHWDKKDLPKKRSWRLYEIVNELRDDLLEEGNKDEAWKYTQLMNLLKTMSERHKNSYLINECSKRTRINLFVEDENADLDDCVFGAETLSDLDYFLGQCQTMEFILLKSFVYDNDQEYYINNLASYVTLEAAVPAINGLCGEVPEMLKDKQIMDRCSAVIELKHKLYRKNYFINHDTKIKMPIVDEQNKYFNVLYSYRKDIINDMKQYKEQKEVKRLYKKMQKGE